MKKKLFTLILAATMVFSGSVCTKANAPERMMRGTYAGHGAIVTRDGNLWKVTGKKYKRLKAGTRLWVRFDTKGTTRKTDDVILSIYRKAAKRNGVTTWKLM